MYFGVGNLLAFAFRAFLHPNPVEDSYIVFYAAYSMLKISVRSIGVKLGQLRSATQAVRCHFVTRVNVDSFRVQNSEAIEAKSFLSSGLIERVSGLVWTFC